jgi:hypothetical protein
MTEYESLVNLVLGTLIIMLVSFIVMYLNKIVVRL